MKGTSSRRNASKALLAVGLLTAAGLGGRWLWRGVARAPRLALRPGPKPPPRTREGLYLALCSMPDTVRADLFAHLSSALATASPLVEDFAGDHIEDVVRERRPWLLPLLNASLTLADGAFSVGEGHAVALPPGRCAGEATCIEAWGSARDAAPAERIRMAAWPLSFGFVVRLPSSPSAARAAFSLRAAVARPRSSLGLVVDAASSRLLTRIELGDLEAQARALRRRMPDGLEPLERQLLDALSADGVPDVPLPWLSLGTDELLVSPRQGALARPADVLGEVRAALGEDALTALAAGPGSPRFVPLSSLHPRLEF